MTSEKFILIGIVILSFILTITLMTNSSPNSGTTRQSYCVSIEGPYFCPEDNCSQVVIRWIERANESIDLAMYSFTLDSIGEALVRAKERGIRVRVIMESNQVNRWSEYTRLKKAGVEVRLDKNPAYMHNKFMVVDGKVVLTGSFNYSKQADTKNDENLIVIVGSDVAMEYGSEFDEMWSGIFGE